MSYPPPPNNRRGYSNNTKLIIIVLYTKSLGGKMLCIQTQGYHLKPQRCILVLGNLDHLVQSSVSPQISLKIWVVIYKKVTFDGSKIGLKGNLFCTGNHFLHLSQIVFLTSKKVRPKTKVGGDFIQQFFQPS